MRSLPSRRHADSRTLRGTIVGIACLAACATLATAQSCTTQAKMTDAQRGELGVVAYRLATAVQSGDSAAVQTATIARFAADFTQTGYLIHSVSPRLTGDTLTVTQLYLLDASARTANDTSDADFSCPLTGTAAETDFSISGLPSGRYAFAMVEASGAHSWLLSFLLQADAGGWKMAGFYPHARSAAGHDGVWYWSTARADAKASRPWLAWLLYGQADQLLRPAAFVSSTNLDRLRSETQATTPPALSEGLSASVPLALAGTNGAEFRITGLASEGSEDGRQLNLEMHIRGDAGSDAAAATTRNVAAGTALLAAHPELRTGFDNLWIIADVPGASPFVTERPIAEFGAK